MQIVVDIEADNFLKNVSKIHCIVAKDLDTQQIYKFRPHQIEDGLKFIMAADKVVMHNGIFYDIPVMSKLYPWFFIPEDKVVDTLVLSRFIYPDMYDQDQGQWANKMVDRKGSHSLEAWGQRLDNYKGEYTGGFDEFSEEMLEYNVQDVEVTVSLYLFLTQSAAYSQKASILEHKVANIIARQERYGWYIDQTALDKLIVTLLQRRQELDQKLKDTFKPFYLPNGYLMPKVDQPKKGITKGSPFSKIKLTVFNINSRDHIAHRLKALYGWEPSEYTETGKPKIDEDVLSSLPYPEAKLLAEAFKVQKTLGQIAEGDKGWIKFITKEGRIHGEVNTNGAVTSRATHSNPNVAQTPANDALFGHECRSCWSASPGKVMVGADCSGLELRMLAHYMSKWDGGAYAKEVVDGDVHTLNQNAAQLPTRNNAKTVIYALLYGAGDNKLGTIVGEGAKRGKLIRTLLLNNVPALGSLTDTCKAAAKGRKFLYGLDRRRLPIRHAHAALNTLLQAAGAIVCKQWMAFVDDMIIEMGWRQKVQQVGWIHDELQFDCDPDIAEQFGKLVVDCITKVEEHFGIQCPLTGEYKIGKNWSETH